MTFGTVMHIGNESVPIQLAQCYMYLPELTICNVKYKYIYFEIKVQRLDKLHYFKPRDPSQPDPLNFQIVVIRPDPTHGSTRPVANSVRTICLISL